MISGGRCPGQRNPGQRLALTRAASRIRSRRRAGQLPRWPTASGRRRRSTTRRRARREVPGRGSVARLRLPAARRQVSRPPWTPGRLHARPLRAYLAAPEGRPDEFSRSRSLAGVHPATGLYVGVARSNCWRRRRRRPGAARRPDRRRRQIENPGEAMLAWIHAATGLARDQIKMQRSGTGQGGFSSSTPPSDHPGVLLNLEPAERRHRLPSSGITFALPPGDERRFWGSGALPGRFRGARCRCKQIGSRGMLVRSVSARTLSSR